MTKYSIKNVTDNDIKIMLGGKVYTFKANSTSEPIKEEYALFFARHIGRRVARAKFNPVVAKNVQECTNEALVSVNESEVIEEALKELEQETKLEDTFNSLVEETEEEEKPKKAKKSKFE